jgi:hypothetical protein
MRPYARLAVVTLVAALRVRLRLTVLAALRLCSRAAGVVPELGDEDDTAIIACAAVSLGYHDPEDAADKPRAWDTRDGH